MISPSHPSKMAFDHDIAASCGNALKLRARYPQPSFCHLVAFCTQIHCFHHDFIVFMISTPPASKVQGGSTLPSGRACFLHVHGPQEFNCRVPTCIRGKSLAHPQSAAASCTPAGALHCGFCSFSFFGHGFVIVCPWHWPLPDEHFCTFKVILVVIWPQWVNSLFGCSRQETLEDSKREILKERLRKKDCDFSMMEGFPVLPVTACN